jgi:hypothetical protein
MDDTAQGPFLFADLTLARRLERAEARSNAEFVETRARLFPESGARWIEVAGAYALFDGVKSPATQSFGLGLFGKATPADIERMEAFFRENQAPVFHEVSPLAELGLLTLLNERRYQPMEFTSVMFRPIDRVAATRNPRIQVRRVQVKERELYAQTAAKGWSDSYEFPDQLLEFGRLAAQRPNGHAFLAELDGRAVASGAMSTCGGVALMAGASTLPEARRRGAQLALLESRLRFAAEQGCDIAMMCAAPGSASQRNAERHGFRIAYTRIKWRLPESAG